MYISSEIPVSYIQISLLSQFFNWIETLYPVVSWLVDNWTQVCSAALMRLIVCLKFKMLHCSGCFAALWVREELLQSEPAVCYFRWHRWRPCFGGLTSSLDSFCQDSAFDRLWLFRLHITHNMLCFTDLSSRRATTPNTLHTRLQLRNESRWILSEWPATQTRWILWSKLTCLELELLLTVRSYDLEWSTMISVEPQRLQETSTELLLDLQTAALNTGYWWIYSIYTKQY